MTEVVINEQLACNYTDHQYLVRRQQSHIELAPEHFQEA